MSCASFQASPFILNSLKQTRKPNPRKKILVPCQLNPPNPKCIVCPEKPEVNVTMNLQKMTVKALEEKILKGELNMVSPGIIASS